jgi:lipid-A-disaccharide synthase
MVITYVMDGHQARVFERLGRPVIGLPNIVLAHRIAPEIVQAKPDPSAVVSAARELIESKKARHDQCEAFGELAETMKHGAPAAPRQDPADRVLAYWKA